MVDMTAKNAVERFITNMRDIKFRAWNKIEKKMYSHYAHQGKNTRLYTAWLKDDDLEVDLELMQYTGLKDKNGKEIYEGDIVKSEKEQIFQINYQDEWGAFIAEEGELGSLFFLAQDSRWDSDVKLHTDRAEVIGNIYENPELIT